VAEEPVPQEARGGLFQGFVALPRGLAFLLKNPRLWPLSALPLLINLVVYSAMAYLAIFHLLPWLVDSLTPTALPGFLAKFGDALIRIIRGVIYVVCVLLMIVLGAVTFTSVGTVLAAPFNDFLSEAVEAILRHEPSLRPLTLGNLMEDLARTVLQAAWKSAIVLVTFVVTVPLLLIPVVGAIVYTVLNGVVATWFMALEYIDLPMSRAGWTLPSRRKWAGQRRAAIFGFGGAVYLTMLVPLLNFLLMPAAVAGGTILYVELEDAARAAGAPPSADAPGTEESPPEAG
jgi:CysZ protein